jgi:hypothetical protein
MLNTRESIMQDSEKPNELPGNTLDHSSDHETSQNGGSKESADDTPHQDATVEIDQPGGTATNVEGAGKEKHGGYGYYVVSNEGS